VFAVKEGKIFLYLQNKKNRNPIIYTATSSFLLDERKFSKEKFAL
jgi:hypothetical protein